MEIIFLLILIGITVTSGFLLAFIWAVRKGHYEDTISPSVRILFEEGKPKFDNTTNEQTKNKE